MHKILISWSIIAISVIIKQMINNENITLPIINILISFILCNYDIFIRILQYEKYLFIMLLIYPLTDYCQNQNMLYYYNRSGHITRLPVVFYYTYFCIYFTISSIISIDLSLITNNNILKHISDILVLNSVTLNTICAISFWSLYLIDPSLVKPSYTLKNGLETPIFTELALHLIPFLISFKLFIKNKVVLSLKHRIGFIINCIYMFLVFRICKYYYGTYPYTFLEQMGVLNIIIAFVVLMLLGLLIQTILHPIKIRLISFVYK